MTNTPREAGTAKKSRLFGHVLGGLWVAACASAMVIAAGQGQLVLALLLFGFTIFWAIPYGLKFFVDRIVPRATVDSTGTTLRPGRSADVLAAAMMTVGLVTGVAWAALGVAGTVTWPFGAHYGLGYLVFFGGLALFGGWYLVTMVKNSGTAYARFTLDGCVLAEGFTMGRARWAEVAAVTDDPPVYTTRRSSLKTKRTQPYARCPISITKTDGTVAAVPNGNIYAADGDALRDWIRFYWQHPEHRSELVDDRALARLTGERPDAP